MDSPSPMEWIKRANEICDSLTVLYHKPNSLKWAGIDEIPPLMARAVILREDRRFGNDFFPSRTGGTTISSLFLRSSKSWPARPLRMCVISPPGTGSHGLRNCV